MKKTFNANAKIGLLEEVLFDHMYDSDKNQIIRTHVSHLLVFLLSLEIVALVLALA